MQRADHVARFTADKVQRTEARLLIDRYDGKLRRYTRRLGVHSPDDQDDVLQEIFIKVYRNLNGFDIH